MEQELTKEIAEKIMEIKGEVRGVVFTTDIEYILEKKGEEDLQKIEEELQRLGYPIKYHQMKAMDFYPVGLRALSLLVTKQVLNFDDQTIEEMGFLATKKSLIVKLFIKYFLSIQRVFSQEAPRIWDKHWNIGKLIPVELNEDKKYGILRVENFALHPIYCVYLRGYFKGILQMLVKTSKITAEETKCIFKGSKYHEYLLKWE